MSSQTSNSPSRGRGRRGRGGRSASVASHASQGSHPTTTAHEAITVTATDNGSSSIIGEVRAMRNELAARLDGFNERLGEVERWQRNQPDDEDQEESDGEEQLVGIQHHVDAATSPIPQANTTGLGAAAFGERTPPFVNTVRPQRLPPHMTQAAPTTPVAARALRAQTFVTLDNNGNSPLDRFHTLNSQDKRKVRRAMNKLGLQVPEFMPDGEVTITEDEVEDAGDRGDSNRASPQQQLSGVENSPASSNESPIRSSAPPTITPAPNIAPAPNIRPGQPLNCKQEFLGKFAGDPSRLEAFLIRVRDVIRSDRESPAWLAAVLRALPIALTDDAAIWHEGLSDPEAAELTSFEAWAKSMRAAFPVNEPMQRREARERRWLPSKETASAYQFVKIRLLRQAYGFDQPDHALVTDIIDGFPTSFAAMLHMPRTKPTLQDLRDQIGEWEHRWREMYHTPLLDKNSTSVQSPSTTLGRIQNQAMVRSASAPALPAVSNASAILLEPCHKEITAEGVAAIISNRVLRMGWRPKRLISGSEARVSGSVMTQLCTSLGAVSAPSSPHHQQANAVERAVQTVQSVLQVMALPSKAHWDRRIVPSVELAMNSSTSSVTGQRPFDLIFISHPSVVHAVFDEEEHLGVGSFPERLSAAHERLAEACRHTAAARVVQKRRYDQRRARSPIVLPGMRAWIRLRDRPIAGTVVDKLDARKSGPYVVEEVLSPHRVRLSLPAGMDIDSVFSIEQLDFEPAEDDPYAADRSAAVSTSPPIETSRSADALILPHDTNGESAPVASREPSSRVRHVPTTLRDFQVGTVRAMSSSSELNDLLYGPLSKPRTIRDGDEEIVLTERPVVFLSRLTSPAESRLVAPELELVCLAWAFQKLAHLLEGAITTVVTDHSPMERMLRSTTAIPYGPTITRCRAILMPHLSNLRFVYRPGSRHTNADALSRLPIDQGRSSP
ncbi:hypothetical protein CF326_g8070 [Tilletia indica]|nr:hypothetical protein CF326_g8070 [Tilletia indica]